MTYRYRLWTVLLLAFIVGCQEPSMEIMSVSDGDVSTNTAKSINNDVPQPTKVEPSDPNKLILIDAVPATTATSASLDPSTAKPLPANRPITLEDVRPSAPVPFIAYQTGTMLNVTRAGAKIADAEFVGFVANPRGVDGRGVMVWAKDVTITNCTFRHGDDDALGFIGECGGSAVVDCKFPVEDWHPGFSHLLIGYANTENSAIAGPFMFEPVNFLRCVFGGGAIRLSTGPYDFHDCDIWVGQLYGMDVTDVKLNLRRCRFHFSDVMPKDAGYWYQRLPKEGTQTVGNYDPCPVRVGGFGADRSLNLKSRIYVENCELIEHASMDWNSPILNRKPIDGEHLCRRIANNTDRKAGRTAYSLAGSVPNECFVKVPNK